MSPPFLSTSLGVVEWFEPGDEAHVESALRQMRELGIGRLRTHLSWAEYHNDGGAAWFDWLLPRLAEEVELLPCVHYTPPSLSETARANGPPRELDALAGFVDHALDRYGGLFDTLELWNEPNNLLDWDWRVDTDWLKFCTMVGAAAYWARQRGQRVVLGGPCPNDLNWLELMGERGVLSVVDALGIHGFPGTWDSEEGVWQGWDSLIPAIAETVRRYNADAELWITETGYSTWRADWTEQIRRFQQAVAAPVTRLYWYGLKDLAPDRAVQEGLHFDQRHYHLGLYDTAGRPKLLARLLAKGGPAELEQTLALERPAPRPVAGADKAVLITGGAGFIGANLADRLAGDGRRVLIYDALARDGVERNLAWLKERHPHRIEAVIADLRDRRALAGAARRSEAVFHFAAQVAVTSSIADPLHDFEVNLGGTMALLELLRADPMPLVFASTNKVYGDLADIEFRRGAGGWEPVDAVLRRHGIDESRPLEFHSPYGCSKGAADQYVLDYARTFRLPAAVLRMSCIYGQRQFGTEDQGWVAHFLISALGGRGLTLYGDGHQVRDILHVDDAVAAYLAVWRRIDAAAGKAFNLGGGPDNAVCLVGLIRHIEDLIDRPVAVAYEDWRQGDQRYFVADTRKARKLLELAPPIGWRRGVSQLARWLAAERGVVAAEPHTAQSGSLGAAG